MIADQPRDLETTRTRRSLLATASGLLLPAGLLLADADADAGEAKATKRANGRRRRRLPRGMWANDTVINFRNATGKPLEYLYSAYTSTYHYRTVDPGAETGFAAGVDSWRLSSDLYLYLRIPGADTWLYEVLAKNFEIATPAISITTRGQGQLVRNVSMDENTTVEYLVEGDRLHIHRWSNGKEPLDDYDEWYTRFFVTMSFA